MPNQSKIILSYNRFLKHQKQELVLNRDGICSGAAINYLLYKAKDQAPIFFQLYNKIASLKRSEYAAHAATLAQFAGKIEVAFTPGSYIKNYKQWDIDKISKLLGKEHCIKLYDLPLVCRTERLSKLLAEIIHDEELVWLGSKDHAIALYKKGKAYYLWDSNSDDGEFVTFNCDRLASQIKSCLSLTKEQQADPFLAVAVVIFSNPNKQNSITSVYPSKQQIAKQLLEDIKSVTPVTRLKRINDLLILCCRQGDLELLRELLSVADIDSIPIINPELINMQQLIKTATAYGLSELVEFLIPFIQSPIKLKTITVGLWISIMTGHVSLFKKLRVHHQELGGMEFTEYFKSIEKNDLLHLSCKSGNPEMVAEMLAISSTELMISNNEQGLSPLLIAVTTGHDNIVELLLKQEAIRNDKVNLSRAVREALKNGNGKIALLLLAHDTSLTVEALPLAIKYNVIQVVSYIIEKNSAIDKSLFNLDSGHDDVATVVFNTIWGQQDTLSQIGQFIHAILNHRIEKLAEVTGADLNLDELNEYGTSLEALLKFLCRNGDVAALKVLFSNVAILTEAQRFRSKLYIQAAKQGQTACVTALLSYLPRLQLTDSMEYSNLLFKACKENDIDVLESLLEAGANPNITNAKQETAIKTACENRNEEVICKLIEAGADVNKVKNDLICLISVCNYSKLLERLLLKKEFDISQPVMFDGVSRNIFVLAATYHQWNVVKTLLNQDIKPQLEDASEILNVACLNGEVEIARMLCDKIPQLQISDELYIKIFMDACENNYPDTLAALQATGKTISELPCQELVAKAFCKACQKGQASLVKQLLKLSVDKNCVVEGRTPLEYAAQNKQAGIVNGLLLKGAVVPHNFERLIAGLYEINMSSEILTDSEIEIIRQKAYEKGHVAIYQNLFGDNHYLKKGRVMSQLSDIGFNMAYKVKPSFIKLKQNSLSRVTLLDQNALPSENLKAFAHFPTKKDDLLELACQQKRPDTLLNLLRYGANPLKLADKGKSLLASVASEGYHDVVVALLKKSVASDYEALNNAAKNGHHTILKLLVDSQVIKDHLFNAIKKRDWPLAASLLEMMNSDLNTTEINVLQKHRYQIRDAYLKLLKDHKNPDSYREDALVRVKSVISINENALGKLLNIPVNSIGFWFSRVIDEDDAVKRKVTRSIKQFCNLSKQLKENKIVEAQSPAKKIVLAV